MTRSGHPLGKVVPFVSRKLQQWAAAGQYGEIRIVVQGGQIEFVHVSESYRDGLPTIGQPPGTDDGR